MLHEKAGRSADVLLGWTNFLCQEFYRCYIGASNSMPMADAVGVLKLEMEETS